MKKEKIEDKLKELNAIRAMHHRDLERFEQQYHAKKISKEDFEKHNKKYTEQREKIRKKIQNLETKLTE
ncbi:MAG: hypothetical protein KKC68_06975 [Candidatus Thermoplasmatota archaeon]|nr:hypothetical protein [Candidatus Thermoplasmatota archaeon]MBU1941502.1 hypothetical protein [Candidatus Thermoplasmatota archaeon]